jgi:hypothetical protein
MCAALETLVEEFGRLQGGNRASEDKANGSYSGTGKIIINSAARESHDDEEPCKICACLKNFQFV